MPNFPTNITKRDGNVKETNPKGALGSEGNPYKLGERGSGIRLQGVLQDFDALKKECLSSGTLFEDPEFPAEDTSIFPMERPVDEYPNEIVWKRPKEIKADAKFFVDGTSRFDVKQGQFGNCWFVASVATLAMNKNLIKKVIPPGQGDFNKDYAGIFRFRFWQFGKWVEVVIDDRLPTYDGDLIGISSETSNEFWSALLEKAYAKLHGNWKLLESGFSSQALEDFTGGFGQLRATEFAPPNLFEILLEAQEKNALLACSTKGCDEGTPEYKKLTDHGIAPGHAYSLTKVLYYERKVKDKVEKIPLLRVRNPWGSGEWNGAWSEQSPEYKSISKEDRKKYGFVNKVDGEFLISYDDWKEFFAEYEICYLNPSLFADSNYDQMVKKNWEIGTIEGEWVIGATAGGPLIDDIENFQHNPQYRITLKEESLAIIALMQKNGRIQRAKNNILLLGFHIYKLAEKSGTQPPKPLDADFFKNNKPYLTNEIIDLLTIDEVSPYSLSRQVHRRAKLEPGSYCIIPSKIFPSDDDDDQDSSFLLRVFTEIPNNLEVYDVETGITDVEPPVLESAKLYKDVGKVRNIFRKYAGDDWELDWSEYKTIMGVKLQKEMYDQGFSEDAYRSMVALMDADDSGKIGYHEFQKFWQNGKIWMAAFSKHDENGKGKLKPFKLKETLKSSGYLVNNEILNLLQHRYATDKGSVKFGDYFLCSARINKMISAYDELTSEEIDADTLTLDKWIKTTLKFS